MVSARVGVGLARRPASASGRPAGRPAGLPVSPPTAAPIVPGPAFGAHGCGRSRRPLPRHGLGMSRRRRRRLRHLTPESTLRAARAWRERVAVAAALREGASGGAAGCHGHGALCPGPVPRPTARTESEPDQVRAGPSPSRTESEPWRFPETRAAGSGGGVGGGPQSGGPGPPGPFRLGPVLCAVDGVCTGSTLVLQPVLSRCFSGRCC